jgi:hypothetical protein
VSGSISTAPSIWKPARRRLSPSNTAMRLIHVFVDNASYRKADVVKEWLENMNCFSDLAINRADSLCVLVTDSNSLKTTDNAPENWSAPEIFTLRFVSPGIPANSGVFPKRYGISKWSPQGHKVRQT